MKINKIYELIGTKIIKNMRKIGIIPNFPIVKDRAMEYWFASKEIASIKPKSILDVGYFESVLPFILSGLGYNVTGIDIRKKPIKNILFNTKIGDIVESGFKDNQFDAITAISTIEHLGISSRYNSYEDPRADKKAVTEMVRILKPKGRLIITVPFGKYNKDDVQRTYDKKHIDILLRNKKIVDIKYAKKNNQRNWELSDYNHVKNVTGYNANILISLTK